MFPRISVKDECSDYHLQIHFPLYSSPQLASHYISGYLIPTVFACISYKRAYFFAKHSLASNINENIKERKCLQCPPATNISKVYPIRISAYIHFLQHICVSITEKAMATHSNILAWKILWTEESGRLQSMG